MNKFLAAAAIATVIGFAGSAAMAGAPTFGWPTTDHPVGNVSTRVASTDASVARCTALQGEFDSAIKSHGTAAKVAAAKTLRQEGGQLCASGKANDGVKKLEQALNDIGVKPTKMK